MYRLAVALFAIQAGYHGYTAALPLALGRGGVPDVEIGVIVGVAAVIQIPAALAFGILVDRFGGMRMFVLGGLAYILGSGILLLPGVEPGTGTLPFVVARVFQGIGVAGILPSALSLVPRLAPPTRRGFALAFVGSAHNLTLVFLPPISVAVLTATSLDGVALVVLAFIAGGMALALARPLPFRDYARTAGQDPPAEGARRRFGIAFRRSWTALLLIVFLFVTHWGVITAYLPQRADAAGANIGLFFVADGIAVLLLRVPTGWLADRVRPRLLVLAGLASSFVSLALLLPPPTTEMLILTGAGVGIGAGLVMTPLLVEISRRSSDADRGSGFSLFSASLALAVLAGSMGAAPVVATLGFEAALLATLGAVVVAALLALADDGLGRTASARVRTA